MDSEATAAGWRGDCAWDNSHLHEKFRPLLDRLSGSKVAVITMTGSCCPFTLGHSMAFEVARNLLKERQEREYSEYSEILGALSLNSDGHVSRKLEEKGEEIIDWTSRAMLVRLATAETPWLSISHLKENWVLWDLQQSWESIHFVRYYLNGADDVLKYEKWTWAVDEDSRFITLGRPTYTERLRKLAPETPYFLIGPELPDISSSQVRAALYEEDYEALKKLLHPAVASWCLRHSPYHKKEEKQQPERANPERKLDELYAKELREQPCPEHQACLAQFEKSEIEAIALKRSQEQGRHSAALRAQRQALEGDRESQPPFEPGAMSVEEIWNNMAIEAMEREMAIEEETSLNVLKMVRDAAKLPKLPKFDYGLYVHRQGKVIRDHLASGRLSPESCKFAFLKAVSEAEDCCERLCAFVLLHEMCYTLCQPGMVPVVVKVLEHLERVVHSQPERSIIAKKFLEWGESNFFRHISHVEARSAVEYLDLAQYQRVFLPNWAVRMQQPHEVEEDTNGMVDSDNDDRNHLSALKSLAPPGDGAAHQQAGPRPSIPDLSDLVMAEEAIQRSGPAKRQRYELEICNGYLPREVRTTSTPSNFPNVAVGKENKEVAVERS